jgi:hypothetical protein
MNAAEIATALGGKRSGNQWSARCPAHNDRDPSLIIFDGREGKVQVRCLSGCEPLDVIAALRVRGLWSNGDHTQSVKNVRRETNDSDAAARRNRALALAIWGEARDARNTLAEIYLWSRKLELPKAGSEVVRFHARCPRGSERVPALVVLMRDVETDEPRAIQRIFLNARGAKDGKPMMLGPSGNCAMMLTAWAAAFSDCMSFCPKLFVCEGFETGLALMRDGFAPLWACGDAGHIRTLPLLFGVGQLVICADNDLPGLSAAEACFVRWQAGLPHQWAVIRKRAAEGEDFADG